MKKLLTMMTAVGMSLGLFADFTSPTGDNFDSLTPGAFTLTAGWDLAEQAETNLNVVAYDTELYNGTRPEIAPATAASDVNYLSVKTSFGKPLTRTIDATPIGSGIYFDSLVKFTACDEDPSAASYDEAKLVVYTKEINDGAQTNVYVLAGNIAQDGSATPTIYDCGKWTYGDAWVRLTIKAIANVSTSGSVPAFVVFVNGDAQNAKPLACATARGVSGSPLDNLNNIGAYWNDYYSACRYFPSLVQSGVSKTTIAAAGFDGQGFVDDVTFTTTSPAFAADPQFFTFSWDSNVAGVSYTIGGTEKTLDETELALGSIGIAFVAGGDCVVTVTPATGYVVDTWSATGATKEENNNVCTYTLTAGTAATGGVTTKANTPKMDITINGTAVPGGATSFAAALAIINDASQVAAGDKVYIGLKEDVSVGADSSGYLSELMIESEGDVTIDLKGFDIVGTVDAENTDFGDAVIDATSPVTVIDSVGGGKVYVAEGAAAGYTGVVCADATTVTIGAADGDLGATFEGALTKVDSQETGTMGTISIVRGYFDGETAPTDIASGSVCSATKVEGYWVVAPEAKTGWAIYLAGSGTAADPYQIADEGDLLDLATNMNKSADFPTAGVYFQQTADIALTAPFIGIGLENGKDVATDATKFDPYAFQGTYDGAGYQITGLQLTKKKSTEDQPHDYAGLFNSLYKATIKNVTVGISGTGWAGDVPTTQEWSGGVIAGVVKASTLENCVTIAAATSFTTKKAAGGIAGYVMGGSTLKACTNNINIVSDTNDKAAGLIGCVQKTAESSSSVIIEDCANTGNVTTPSTKTMGAGFVSYTDDCTVTFKGANTFSGTLTGQSVQSVIYLQGGSVALAEGATITVPAAYKTINKNPVSGIRYATVDGNVATLVADNALVAGGSYKVMATGGSPVVTLAAGESITFDTTLAALTSTAGITTSAAGYEVTSASGVYTATPKTLNITYVYTTNGVPVAAAALTGLSNTERTTFTVVDNVTFDTSKITLTDYTLKSIAPASWNAGDKTADVEVTVAFEKAGGSYPPFIPGGNKDAKTKYDTWAKDQGVTDPAAAKQDAFLLNCANTDEAIAAAKANFKVTSITQDADGNWVVKVTGDKGDAEAYGNGYVNIEEVTITGAGANSKFYKATLTLSPKNPE